MWLKMRRMFLKEHVQPLIAFVRLQLRPGYHQNVETIEKPFQNSGQCSKIENFTETPLWQNRSVWCSEQMCRYQPISLCSSFWWGNWEKANKSHVANSCWNCTLRGSCLSLSFLDLQNAPFISLCPSCCQSTSVLPAALQCYSLGDKNALI